MNLTNYRALGRSGLIVSPLCLGTMTYGNTAWGSNDEESSQIFEAYVTAGGNFIDTADVYSGGRSEQLIGQFLAERKLRDQVVLATKFGFNSQRGNPHAGGNGRKHIYQALEGSLKRLNTDYIDLYWLHVYDMVTPVEEVLQTLGDLVSSGQIRYFGFSDMPAWYATKAVTLAQAHHIPGPIAMQLEYSLVSRSLENEHRPAARECGLGILPWSPLAGGFLAGKYQREGGNVSGDGRLSGSNPFSGPFTKFTERNWTILEALRAVAHDLDRPPAQVALAWTLAQPGITSAITGVSKLRQLEDNLAALEIAFTPQQRETLDKVSSPGTDFFSRDLRRMVFGGTEVGGWTD